ncbi:MAG: AAA family ATPase [Bacteroidales bacterium]|nr:AAA family ATPase [Bacteroidales bacterium]
MKIKSIHIYNIASIVDEKIDFTSQPLSDSDVFLITGNMGAGKTTILDSICLALYNTTPRLKDRGNVKVENNQDDITLDDPRRLMRRNTGEAYVELLFTGLDGNDYEAVWQVQRGKKKKPDSSLSNTTWSLKNMTTGDMITASKQQGYKEVEAAIQKVVGLDFNQFCRTTMLAQGEFTRFLKSNEKEKTEILEKLTKFDEYTSAGRLVFLITQEKEAAYKKAQEAASDTGLSDEVIEEKQQTLNAWDKELESIRRLHQALLSKHQWLETESTLLKQKTEAEEEAKKASEELESQEYQENQRLVSQWNDSISVRGWMQHVIEAEKSIQSNRAKIEQTESHFRQAIAGLAYLRANRDSSESTIRSLQQSIESQSGKFNIYRDAQTIIGYLKAIGAASHTIDENNWAIATENEKLESELKPNVAKAADELQKSRDAVLSADNEIGQKENELNGLDLATHRTKQRENDKLISNIGIAMDAVNAIRDAQQKYDEETGNIAIAQKQLEQKKEKLQKSVLPEYEAAKAAKNAAEELLDKLKDSVHRFAKQMRSHLSVGCKCPVCQQEVQKLPIEEELEESFKEAENVLKSATQRFMTAESSRNTIEAEIKVDAQALNTRVSNHEKDNSVSLAKANALTACVRCGLSAIDESTLMQLEQLKTEKTTFSQHLQEIFNQGEALDQVLRTLRTKRNNLAKEVESKRKAETEAEKKRDACIGRIETLRAVNQQKEKEISDNEQLVENHLKATSWEHDWRFDRTAFIQELTDATKAYNDDVAEKTKAESHLNLVTSSIENVQGTIDRILEAHEPWKQIDVHDAKACGDLANRATKVLTTVTECTNGLSLAQKDLDTYRPQIESYLQGHTDMTTERIAELETYSAKDIVVIGNKLETLRSAKTTKDEGKKRAQEAYDKHQSSKPVIEEGDTPDVLKSRMEDCESKKGQINQEIGSLNKELEDDRKKKSQLGDLKAKAEQAQKEYSKWQRLNHFIGDAEGTKFQKIAQSYILGGLLNSANEYLKKLEPRYSLKAVPGTLHISLEDAYQGFATRSTDSLSGGEGFLVSLALALALSDIGQSLAVDTLFIDEGFGTLSGIPLANAINTLRTLHGQNGRHVGIISHIKEVRENIPIQIRVEQNGNNSSSSINIGIFNN